MIKQLMMMVVILATAGCASFPQEEIKTVDQFPEVAQFENKPQVYVDLKFFRGEPNNANAIDITSSVAQLQPLVKKVFDEKQVFESYTFDAFAKDKAEYTVKLHFYNHGSTGGAAVSGFITGFTMGIIPGSATDNYTLKSAVIDANGLEVASKQTKDSVSTWIGIWFLPAMGNTPAKAIDQTLSNMVEDSLRTMIESKQLQYSLLEKKIK